MGIKQGTRIELRSLMPLLNLDIIILTLLISLQDVLHMHRTDLSTLTGAL